jgi:hypothetical protein
MGCGDEGAFTNHRSLPLLQNQIPAEIPACKLSYPLIFAGYHRIGLIRNAFLTG